jgi:nicotinamidase-related amidase
MWRSCCRAWGSNTAFNGPTQPAILAELPDVEPIDRTSMNSFEDESFRQAVEATGRERLIFGALQTEVCLAFAVVEALRNGYEAMFVTDATGSRTQAEHRTAIERLAHAGAVPNTAVGVVCELFRDWAGPLGAAAQETTGWYFSEVAKVTDKVGIAEAERLRSQAQPAK